MNSAGPSWEECEKENFWKSRNNTKAELETLVTFLSKFDSKVEAIWGEGGGGGVGGGDYKKGVGNKNEIWEQLEPSNHLMSELDEVEEDLLISPKTHFKPIRDFREEIQQLPPPPPIFLPIPQQDPAEYAVYNRTANSSFPLQFKLKSSHNDKGVQTECDDEDGDEFYIEKPFGRNYYTNYAYNNNNNNNYCSSSNKTNSSRDVSSVFKFPPAFSNYLTSPSSTSSTASSTSSSAYFY